MLVKDKILAPFVNTEVSPVVTPEMITEVTTEESKKKTSGRVDINNLLARVRDERKKENKLNLIFFGLFASLIVVVGIILSF